MLLCTALTMLQVLRAPSVGSLDVPQLAVERDLANAGLHMLVEKPISMRPTEEVERLAQVRPAARCSGKVPD